MASVAELKLDAEELRQFVDTAKRQKVKDILSVQLRKLETDLIQKTEQLQIQDKDQTANTEPKKTASQQPQRKTVDIKTYGWDQSDKFMKIYATVDGVQNVPKEQVTCSYTEGSFELRCDDVEDKNYVCRVANLHDQIIPADSYIKIKTNSVLVMLKKESPGKTWPHVTKKAGSKDKAPKKPEVDGNADPNDNLMTMMKQMYEEGDDEMKRSIAKAWTESRDKQGAGLT